MRGKDVRALALGMAFFFLTTLGVWGQQSQQSFTPAWVPLAVRSPHLNAWVWNSSETTKHWPRFGLDTDKILAWSQFVKVDGVSYSLLGDYTFPGNYTVKSSRMTPTRTIIVTDLGGFVEVTTTFFSPIEPGVMERQSMPFAYMSVKASSIDGKPHVVALYSDVTGEWVSDNASTIVTWDTVQAASYTYHKVQRKDLPLHPFEENAGVAEDATLFFGIQAAKTPPMSYRTDGESTTRDLFVKEGNLGNKATMNDRAISAEWPVVAFAYNLGTVENESEEVIFAIGLARNQIIKLKVGSGEQVRYPYYLSRYDSANEAFQDFLQDYDDASKRADALDSRIMGEASNKSAEYADLVALGTRQALAGLEITVTNASDGTLDTSDIQAFMKDSGNSLHVNSVQVMYAAAPALLYINATWLGYLLKASLQHANSLSPSPQTAPQDLGFSYPAASGDTSSPDSSLGVEASSTLLILAYAHATFSGDGALIQEYYDNLKTWADYLAQHTLYPNQDQNTAEGDNGADNTNLALKGILGLHAMSRISESLHKDADAADYAGNASGLISQWKDLAVAGDHLALTYDDPSSSGLIFNMYADKLLKTNIVSDDVYELQTRLYGAELDSGQAAYGLPYRSDHNTGGRADLSLLAAAAASNGTTRDAFIKSVWNRAANNSLDGCFPYAYSLDTGTANTGTGSPALGAVYSLLALDLKKRPITFPAADDSSQSSRTKAIVGGVVGGVAGAALLALATFFFLRRRARLNNKVVPELVDSSLRDTTSLPQPWRASGSEGGIPRKRRNMATPEVTASNIPSQMANDVRKTRTPSTTTSPPARTSYAADGTLAATTETHAQPESTASAGDSNNAAGDTTLLRNKLENLRREVVEIRHQQSYADVPPPEYS
ncbi:uncharacterized protein SCHCODRAFT_02626308 [Schizophyllum commune H4-8]|nr:uncharacterized protein SCHCODRAFT_02626308 [Schizophyllum commune H4-8]KAI5892498.1 hypothetical protein SCHCODRAFT_02626308 [Schizophyllum commune H4-8]